MIKLNKYRTPNAPVSYYDNILHDFDIIFSYGHNFIVTGDFNYDTSKENQATKVHHIENSFLLNQIIDEPTRVTPSSATIIDHIYISNHIVPAMSGVLPIPISDHYTIFLILASECVSSSHVHKTVTKRCYNHFDYDNFIRDILFSETLLSVFLNFLKSMHQFIPFVSKIRTIIGFLRILLD